MSALSIIGVLVCAAALVGIFWLAVNALWEIAEHSVIAELRLADEPITEAELYRRVHARSGLSAAGVRYALVLLERRGVVQVLEVPGENDSVWEMTTGGETC